MPEKEKHIIDCNKLPFVPDGWLGIKTHYSSGEFEWDPNKIKLYHPGDTSCLKCITGKYFFGLISRPLNANVLDYLLKHPELIPEEWKGKNILFFGTTYKQSDICVCVRCLLWNGTKWIWGYMPLYWDRFSIGCPAAVFVK